MELRLEAVVVPVADVDRSKDYYTKLGWRLDADFPFDNGFRVVQFTPPGSPCSVQFGTKITLAAPGSAQGLYLIVSDIAAAREDILRRGVQISEIFHPAMPGAQFQQEEVGGRASGPDPGHKSYSSFATFRDPDGNSWLLQEVTTRLPDRGLSLDVPTLAGLLHETEEHHGAYEKSHPKHNWWDWYAAYIHARQQGSTPDEAASAAGLYLEKLRDAAIR